MSNEMLPSLTKTQERYGYDTILTALKTACTMLDQPACPLDAAEDRKASEVVEAVLRCDKCEDTYAECWMLWFLEEARWGGGSE